MSRYFLESHAFVRVMDGRAFFLDVRRDEYVCVTNSAALARNVSGWPVAAGAGDRDVRDAEDATISQLLTHGLLTTSGKTAEGVEPPSATRDWFDEWRTVSLAETAPYILPFALSFMGTLLAWRLRSLEHNIRTLERRARRHAQSTDGNDAESMRRLTGVFLLLRAWAYTARDRCLFDSLVMTDFLNRCGRYPTFVMGIRTGPFRAHCWTQHGDCALNELDTRTRQYAPILAVGP